MKNHVIMYFFEVPSSMLNSLFSDCLFLTGRRGELSAMDIFDFFCKIIDATKYIFATFVVLVYVLVIFVGITNSYNSDDFGGPLINLILLTLVLVLLACNEGFQVGILGIEHLNAQSIDEKGYKGASKIHQLMYPQGGSRIKQLLIGQSFLVVLCSFIISDLTTFTKYPTIDGT